MLLLLLAASDSVIVILWYYISRLCISEARRRYRNASELVSYMTLAADLCGFVDLAAFWPVYSCRGYS